MFPFLLVMMTRNCLSLFSLVSFIVVLVLFKVSSTSFGFTEFNLNKMTNGAKMYQLRSLVIPTKTKHQMSLNLNETKIKIRNLYNELRGGSWIYTLSISENNILLFLVRIHVRFWYENCTLQKWIILHHRWHLVHVFSRIVYCLWCGL